MKYLWVSESDEGDMRKLPKEIRKVSIFDTQKVYSIIIDRGSAKPENQFEQWELQKMYTMLDEYIQEKEYNYFFLGSENNLSIQKYETINDIFLPKKIIMNLSPQFLVIHLFKKKDRYRWMFDGCGYMSYYCIC